MKTEDKDNQAYMYQEQRAEQSAMDEETKEEFREELKQKSIIKANIAENIGSIDNKCNLCGKETEEDRCQDCFEEWGNGWPDR